jgi:putative ABC transport system permease protein
MTTVSLRGLFGRKLRTILTSLAIVLGVAMVSGGYVLTDSISKAFDTIFAASYDQTDAVISGKSLTDYSNGGRATVSRELLERVRSTPGVAAAAGSIFDLNSNADQAKIIDKNGKVVEGGGNPTFGMGVDPKQPRFNPLKLTSGHWASGAGEVVIDETTATRYDFAVGDPIKVAIGGPVRSFTLAGIARYGDVSSIGGATFAIFDVDVAQQFLHKRGYDAISVAAADGVTKNELVQKLEAVAPSNAQVKTGDQQANEDKKGVSTFIKIIRYALLGFGGIALFVGGFVIFNTLSITVAQRTRELATLRTLGASRRQVLRSVVLEAFAIGLLASVIGLAVGYGLAFGLAQLFAALNLDMPRTTMVLSPRTIAVSVGMGTIITVLAGLFPALRATNVPPISAVREGATLPKGRFSKYTFRVALAVTALSVASLTYSLFANDVPLKMRLAAMVGGVLFLFIGVAMSASRLVKPIASVIGRPVARTGGIAGRLARENAVRNPGRTASTAAALMIGLALVTFVAAFGKGLIDSDKTAVEQQLNNVTHVVVSTSGWTPLPTTIGTAVQKSPAVEAASSVRYDRARFGVENIDVAGVDPGTIASLYRFDWAEGGDEIVQGLTAKDAVVRKTWAEDQGLAVGDTFSIRTPSAQKLTLRVAGLYQPADFDALLGQVVITQQAFDASFEHSADVYTFVRTSNASALATTLKSYPDARVLTEQKFVADRTKDFKSMLNLLYGLLALSVIVSLFGMVNTLALAVFERTREIGMLRAVGLTRRQARRMIRRESIITALIGASLGIPLGLGLAALVTHSLSSYGVTFSFPLGAIAIFTSIAVWAGTLAAILPARRAGKLNVLAALQYE